MVFENKVIAGFGDHLKGFDANSGKVLWNTKNKRGKKARCGSGAVNVLAGKCVIGAIMIKSGIWIQKIVT